MVSSEYIFSTASRNSLSALKKLVPLEATIGQILLRMEQAFIKCLLTVQTGSKTLNAWARVV